MKAIPTIAFSVLLPPLILAGCAADDSTYDRTAMRNASETAHQASVSCVTKWAVKEIQTYSQLAACNLTAERKYYTAIKLQKMDKFEAYAAGYQMLAEARDAHRISDQQAGRRAGNMRRDFLAACSCTPMRGDFGFPDSPRSLGP